MDYERDFVKVPRAILRMLAKDPVALQVYMQCALRARWATGRGTEVGTLGPIELGQGEAMIGRSDLASECGASEASVRGAISRLHRLRILAIRPTSRGSIVKLCGYGGNDDPRLLEQPAEQPAARQPNSQPLASRSPADQPLTRSKKEEGRTERERAPLPPEPRIDRSQQAPDPRVKINHDAWAYAAAKHAELRAEGLDPGAVPFPAMPSGAGGGDLVARTRELAGDPPDYERAMEVHRRRIDVMVAECRREDVRHLKWFTPSRIWEERGFYKAAELSPAQAAAPRAPRISPRPAEPPTLRLVDAGEDDYDNLPPSRWAPVEKRVR